MPWAHFAPVSGKLVSNWESQKNVEHKIQALRTKLRLERLFRTPSGSAARLERLFRARSGSGLERLERLLRTPRDKKSEGQDLRAKPEH